MKKKVILILALLLGAKLFAETPNVLIQADLDVNFIDLIYDDEDYGPFCFYMIPYLTAAVQIPTDSDFNMYLGLRALPAIAFNHFELYGVFGYTFAKPEGWKNYHLEVTGNAGLGIQLGFIDSVSVLPITEIGCQVYLMPEDHGFYCGLGPKTFFLFVPYDNPVSVFNSFGVELSAGYKF